ncbi:phosphate ABC transporter ATP-binding protein PstB [Lentilactobacillus kribbianus]|uniref:phosphate ABC transporter ATP-binding protein PstB n=1 Tax=Lentilactobacillus kribbianus TaxID=2729622 RepID=UPI001557436F|nr:phosphate ABC transporter ATP-binding protein PstB [Lentilactobacillus kribbianus]
MKNINTDEQYFYPFEANEPMAIATEALNVYYHDEYHAINDTSLQFKQNQITALIGASGSGKSTYLRSLNRMNDEVAKVTGTIDYHGVDINQPDIDVYEVRRRIGMVFQQPNPFAKSIYDNITFALKRRGITKKAALDEIVETSLKQAAVWDQLKDKLHQSALALSGGQQQRLCIARALAVKPEILLMDEPTSALDPVSTAQLEQTMKQLREQYTIIIVTHNMQQAARVSDYTVFFNAGQVVEYNKTNKIFTRPKIQLTDDYLSGNFG